MRRPNLLLAADCQRPAISFNGLRMLVLEIPPTAHDRVIEFCPSCGLFRSLDLCGPAQLIDNPYFYQPPIRCLPPAYDGKPHVRGGCG